LIPFLAKMSMMFELNKFVFDKLIGIR